MDQALLGDHMRDLLGQEAVLLSRLEALLEKESAALAGDELEEISRIGAERHRCVEDLIQVDSERRIACRMLGIEPATAAFARLLDQCDGSGALKSRWLASLEIAARCKDRNERNGAIVSARLHRVESLLVELRGGRDRVAPVYHAKGTRRFSAGGVELGCA